MSWIEGLKTAFREAGITEENQELLGADRQFLGEVTALAQKAVQRMVAAVSTLLKLAVDHDELTPDAVLAEDGYNTADYQYQGEPPHGKEPIEEILLPGIRDGDSDAQVKYFKDLGYEVNPPSVALARKRAQPKHDGVGPVAYLGGSWLHRRLQWRYVAYLNHDGSGGWNVNLNDWHNRWPDNWRFSVRNLRYEAETPVFTGVSCPDCFRQPPSCLPTSTSGAATARYLGVSSNFRLWAMCKKHLSESSWTLALLIITDLFSLVAYPAASSEAIKSVNKSSILVPSV